MSWLDYSTAPPDGTFVCAASDLGDTPGAALALTVVSDRGRFPLILVRSPAGLRAYVNACPHQYLPLDHRGPQIVTSDGLRLQCTSHAAMFDIETGAGVGGPGLGCSLDPVPIRTQGQAVVIGPPT
ncbi:(2Fe-2S)-binding protein [Mesobaculum littorinae]|uniref:(2Fe-2S)-binding protein n=1 Tax=Mesobaculum littorinae TaxID=2486419 RepID=A0A438ADS4_9RHOB|nr:Rieske 2Fe-2S domain-containing protein [Mesobaculum littorinae]RVV96844.1 (2Fe-2S)-binding protein [Mesobaculum littorinae]